MWEVRRRKEADLQVSGFINLVAGCTIYKVGQYEKGPV